MFLPSVIRISMMAFPFGAFSGIEKSVLRKTRANDEPVPRPAKRPLVMLSLMVDVKTKACIDFELTKHFNERRAAISMLRSVRKG